MRQPKFSVRVYFGRAALRKWWTSFFWSIMDPKAIRVLKEKLFCFYPQRDGAKLGADGLCRNGAFELISVSCRFGGLYCGGEWRVSFQLGRTSRSSYGDFYFLRSTQRSNSTPLLWEFHQRRFRNGLDCSFSRSSY